MTKGLQQQFYGHTIVLIEDQSAGDNMETTLLRACFAIQAALTAGYRIPWAMAVGGGTIMCAKLTPTGVMAADGVIDQRKFQPLVRHMLCNL